MDKVGKTTLCLDFLSPSSVDNPAYLNWDDLANKKQMRNGLLPTSPLVVLYEIHKYKNWRNLVKGFYDKKKSVQKFLITGSAKLDYYRQGGDSLIGRYRYLRLHPLSVNELNIHSSTDSNLQDLLHFGGFPEPYFAKNERDFKLWSRERIDRIVHDDIRDLELVRDLSSLSLLAENLPHRVGSPLSINNLALDLAVNHRTAEHWVQILERVYFCYRLLPFGPPKIKAVKKEKKLYLWDWSAVENPGIKFENFVASHLIKYCHFLEDTQGEKMELRFLRDVDKREIDFVVLKNNRPLFAVECKTGDKKLSDHIRYFKNKIQIPRYYQVHLGKNDYAPESDVRILPFTTFSQEVGLV